MPSSLLYLLPVLFLFSACSSEPATGTAAPGYSSFTSFDGEKIAYQDSGEGQTVMLLHGFINDGSNWRRSELYNQLVSAGYRVITPDLRGNGKSSKPHTDAAYANGAEIKDVMLLADELKLDNYIAVGYSRGSIVLAKLLTADKRISKAVIGGMGADFTDPEWPRRKQFAAAFNGELTPETEGAVEYAKSIGADLKALHLQQKHQPVTSPNEIRSITIPILVAAGSDDKDNGDPGELERMFPNGKLAMMPGDHNNTYKTPVFAAAAMAFIKSGAQ